MSDRRTEDTPSAHNSWGIVVLLLLITIAFASFVNAVTSCNETSQPTSPPAELREQKENEWMAYLLAMPKRQLQRRANAFVRSLEYVEDPRTHQCYVFIPREDILPPTFATIDCNKVSRELLTVATVNTTNTTSSR